MPRLWSGCEGSKLLCCPQSEAQVLQAMDAKSLVKSGYDTIAAQYTGSRKEDTEDVRLLHELMERLPEGAKVLDAGCGSGIPIARLLSQRFNVTGVDFSETQVRLACQAVPQAQFICQDMTKLAFPAAAFDAICSYYAIIHVPRKEHQRLLLNFYRMLKPDGLALLCMGAGDLPEDAEEDWFGTRMYWSHYDGETNVKMLKECGFNIVFAKSVADSLSESAHLFILAQKPRG